MSYNGSVSNRDDVVPGGIDVGISRPPSSDHIEYVKYVNYVYPCGMFVKCLVEQVKLLKQ